jgi:hypothetical protein
MFQEVGLTIDESEMPPAGANPWHDPRYMTPAFVSRKGELTCNSIPRVHVRQLVNPYLVASGFLQGLSGKPLMTVCKFCEGILEREMAERDSDGPRRAMQAVRADRSHQLARIREIVRASRDRLSKVRPQCNGLGESVLSAELGQEFHRAIGALEKLEKAAKTITAGDSKRMMKAVLEVGWPFERPCVAYALRCIFEKHSSPRMEVSEILRRIAFFENKFLHANVAGDGTSVAREISRFKRNADRVWIMRGLLENLLTAEWYVWPPEINPDFEPPTSPLIRGTHPR